MLRGFPSHLDLTVSDLAASVRFYDALLPRLPAGGSETPTAATSASPSSKRARAAPRVTIATRRASITRRSTSTAARRWRPSTSSSSASAPRSSTEYDYTPGYYAVFFADPDGLKLEVVFEPRLRGRTG